MKDTISLLESASKAYYDGNPIIDDDEYDALVDELKAADPDNSFLGKIGTRPAGNIAKHKVVIGSLDKLKTRDEFDSWCSKIMAATNNTTIPFIVQPKLDGITIAIYYKNGVLINAVLRGDGEKGEIVTDNVVRMQNVATSLPNNWSGSLRGEIILPLSNFKSEFEPLGYRNARNTVAGKTRDLKAGDELQHFRVVYFDCVPESTSDHQTVSDGLSTVVEFGLSHVNCHVLSSADDVWEFFNNIDRSGYDYDIDGIVVKANSLATQKNLGAWSDLRPEWARCLKFEASTATTTVVGCQVTLGHTGQLVPTADLHPVEIGGVTVDSALLNNWNIDSIFPSAAHVAIGDEVLIARQGDVIPKIRSVITPVFRNPVDGFVGTLVEFEQKYGQVLFEERDEPLPGTEHCKM